MNVQPMKSTRDVKKEEHLAWLLQQIEQMAPTPPPVEIPIEKRVAPRIRRNGKWVE